MTGRDDTRSPGPAEVLQADLQSLADSIVALSTRDPALAVQLVRLFVAIANEASRGPRLANALARALREPADGARPPRTGASRAGNRRNPGPFDPFSVHAEGGEGLLRERLTGLTLEQLRDIVAEHSMDNDRLAMKWKDPERVIERIVERVDSRSDKGSAFRA